MSAKYGKPPTYGQYWHVLAAQWDEMQIKGSARLEVDGYVHRALAGKDRYIHLERRTAFEQHNDGVPWWLTSIIAERESGQDWSRSLAQGDRWNHASVNEPRGRGPFQSWEDAAVDALHLDHVDKVIDWRLEKALYTCIGFNGWGYYLYHKHMPSPYLWGGTSIQVKGKYVRDGVWSSTTWDTQVGCACMLRALMDADSSVRPIRET